MVSRRYGNAMRHVLVRMGEKGTDIMNGQQDDVLPSFLDRGEWPRVVSNDELAPCRPQGIADAMGVAL